MSLKKFNKNPKAQVFSLQMKEALEEINEIRVFNKIYITEEQYQKILTGELILEEKDLLQYTKLVKWVVRNNWTLKHHNLSLEQALEKYRLNKSICFYMEQDPQRFLDINLAEDRYDRDKYPSQYKYTRFFSEAFLWIVDSLTEFKRMVTLYEEVADRYRVPHSCKQVDLTKVALVSNTPNFNSLPAWVRHALVKYAPTSYLNSGRYGNIWDLPVCCKAWKWQPNLPKKIAYKVGLLSVKARMLSYWAWDKAQDGGTRNETEMKFWNTLKEYSSMPTLAFMKMALGHYQSSDARWGKKKWTNFLELALKIPKGSLALPHDLDLTEMEEAVIPFLDIQTLLFHLFNCSGKATEKAYRASDKARISWASYLGQGNPDLVQKILSLPECIPFFEDTIGFLKSVDKNTAIRLLQSNKFRYRGEINPVSDDLIRDSGYLWNNIKKKPELGRIRCWFSLHTTLASEYVKELPDEAIEIPKGVDRIQGLSAIDKSWEIEIPTSVATLKYWGQVLHNCVGGYGNAIKSGRSVVFVIKEGGHPTHCVEIAGYTSSSPGQINQFHGNHNGYPNYEIKKSVLEALRQAKLVESLL